jgi:hypothetical protein
MFTDVLELDRFSPIETIIYTKIGIALHLRHFECSYDAGLDAVNIVPMTSITPRAPAKSSDVSF